MVIAVAMTISTNMPTAITMSAAADMITDTMTTGVAVDTTMSITTTAADVDMTTGTMTTAVAAGMITGKNLHRKSSSSWRWVLCC